jgi:hypothetical protein
MRTAPALLVAASLLLSLPAAAQTCPPSDPLCTTHGKEKAADVPLERKPATRGVITLAEVTITGRIQKPIAAVDVSRIAPKLTLAELRQPFLDRIEKAIYSDPF